MSGPNCWKWKKDKKNRVIISQIIDVVFSSSALVCRINLWTRLRKSVICFSLNNSNEQNSLRRTLVLGGNNFKRRQSLNSKLRRKIWEVILLPYLVNHYSLLIIKKIWGKTTSLKTILMLNVSVSMFWSMLSSACQIVWTSHMFLFHELFGVVVEWLLIRSKYFGRCILLPSLFEFIMRILQTNILIKRINIFHRRILNKFRYAAVIWNTNTKKGMRQNLENKKLQESSTNVLKKKLLS